MRSRRLPISSTLRDSAFPGLNVSGEMHFSAQEYKPKGHSGLVSALAGELRPAHTDNQRSVRMRQDSIAVAFRSKASHVNIQMMSEAGKSQGFKSHSLSFFAAVPNCPSW